MAWRNSAFKKQYTILVRACIDLGYHLIVWRIVTVYSDPKAYRPITLLKISGKVLEKVV